MTAIDTSVAVPALLAWHTAHDACRPAAAGAAIPAHAALESYSVLTRLPSPHRIDHSTAGRLLTRWFAHDAILAAPTALQRSLVGQLAELGITGGACYDALVAATAREHGHRLVTRDVRAARTYEVLGVDVELMSIV